MSNFIERRIIHLTSCKYVCSKKCVPGCLLEFECTTYWKFECKQGVWFSCLCPWLVTVFCPRTCKKMLFLLIYVGWGGGGLGLNDYAYKKWLDNKPQIWRFIKENAANQSHVFNYLVL